jgi:hypothetical protein
MNIDTSEIKSGGQLDGLCFFPVEGGVPSHRVCGWFDFRGETYGACLTESDEFLYDPALVAGTVDALVGCTTDQIERLANEIVGTDVTSVGLLYMDAREAGNEDVFLSELAGRDLTFGIDALGFGDRPKKSDEFWLARARRRKEIKERVMGEGR